jgi:hypothetical protein
MEDPVFFGGVLGKDDGQVSSGGVYGKVLDECREL